MKPLLSCVLALPLLLAADKAEDAVKKELAKFEGTWKTESIEYNGKQFEDLAKQLRFVFKGDTGTVEGNDKVADEYAKLKLKVDPSTTTKLVDVTVTAGVQKDAVMEGIYEIKGDELRLCLKVQGKDRPSEFKAPAGSDIALIVLKREKK
jgi:uncharacterized protein (TIGR03067 family)